MQYEAMKWDHQFDNTVIQWVVMECAGVTMKAGAIQAVTPRRDIAYFVDPATAESASREFARLRNAQIGNPSDGSEWVTMDNTEFVAYSWDHSAGRDLIKWGVLRWKRDNPGERIDVAYLLDSDTAERDALALEKLLNR